MVNVCLSSLQIEPSPFVTFYQDEVTAQMTQEAQEAQVAQVDSFSPPLYLQRYHKVLEILDRPQWARSIRRVVRLHCLAYGAMARWRGRLHLFQALHAL